MALSYSLHNISYKNSNVVYNHPVAVLFVVIDFPLGSNLASSSGSSGRLGLAFPGLAFPGLAFPGLAFPGLAFPALAGLLEGVGCGLFLEGVTRLVSDFESADCSSSSDILISGFKLDFSDFDGDVLPGSSMEEGVVWILLSSGLACMVSGV
jgi:hypothetical protein